MRKYLSQHRTCKIWFRNVIGVGSIVKTAQSPCSAHWLNLPVLQFNKHITSSTSSFHQQNTNSEPFHTPSCSLHHKWFTKFYLAWLSSATRHFLMLRTLRVLGATSKVHRLIYQVLQKRSLLKAVISTVHKSLNKIILTLYGF